MMICRTCREEVRFGTRDGHPGWWHREAVEHVGFPVPAPEIVEEQTLPPVEVSCHPVDPKDPLVPGGVRTVVNLIAKSGWELRRLTHARGPYVGAKGDVLSTSDTIVLGAREVDGDRCAVASWRDGKFDFSYLGIIKPGVVVVEHGPANATEMKSWIKGVP
jgi:hypothetical protein